MENVKKNWKSTIAFFVYLALFGYAVTNFPFPTKDLPNPNTDIIYITGVISLISWGLTKASSETFNSLVTSFSEAIKNKWSK